MIARIWSGSVSAENGPRYLQLMRDVALPDYKAARGCVEAWCLHRENEESVDVTMLSFWTDWAAIKGFAGEDFAQAKYYDFDPRFLREMPRLVDHFEVIENHRDAPGPSPDNDQPGQRIWRPGDPRPAFDRGLGPG